MRAVIITGGKVEQGFFVSESLKLANLLIAADSGAKTALAWKLTPALLIGDFDSIDTPTFIHFKIMGVKSLSFPKYKNETDTELAVITAIGKGATQIDILGGSRGNRLDHVLANVYLCAYYPHLKIRFLNGNQETWMAKGPATIEIDGKKGDLLSLIPLSQKIVKVTSDKLRFPLQKEALVLGSTRGISNIFLQKNASINFQKGNLLLIHTHTK